jgi:ABC-type lipoprotein export system ATPase subunit
MSNPDILLLDESTANLDDDSRDLIFSILETKNMTIINSTHDPSSFNAKNRLIVSLDEQERFLSYEK